MRSDTWESLFRPYFGQRVLDRLMSERGMPSFLRRDEDDYQMLPVNLFEADEEFMLVAPMPGMREEDIQIDLQRNVLTIHAQFRGDLKPEETGKRYLMHEWRYGPFQRTVEIPAPVDAEGVEANLGNGVLTVRLPKVQAQRPRKIEIRATDHGKGAN